MIAPFARAEFEDRVARARAAMRAAELDAILVTAMPAFRYFTGYFPIISESPARPWFFVQAGWTRLPHSPQRSIRRSSANRSTWCLFE